MTPRMSKQVMRKVLLAQKLACKYADPKKRKKITKKDKEKLEKKALEVIATYAGKLDSKKLPKNPVDRAIAKAMLDNKEKVLNLIDHKTTEGALPSSLDYYAVYYEIMKDSGLLWSGLLDPDTLAQLERWRISERDLLCDSCNHCLGCVACLTCLFCITGAGTVAVSLAVFLSGSGAATGSLVE